MLLSQLDMGPCFSVYLLTTLNRRLHIACQSLLRSDGRQSNGGETINLIAEDRVLGAVVRSRATSNASLLGCCQDADIIFRNDSRSSEADDGNNRTSVKGTNTQRR